MPERIQLRRAKGWRMPDNTVKVDRTTKWGNPFIVGKDGTQAQCVYWFQLMLGGAIHMSSVAGWRALEQYRAMALSDVAELRGKSLACWCHVGKPCHADVLLRLANSAGQPQPAPQQGDTA